MAEVTNHQPECAASSSDIIQRLNEDNKWNDDNNALSGPRDGLHRLSKRIYEHAACLKSRLWMLKMLFNSNDFNRLSSFKRFVLNEAFVQTLCGRLIISTILKQRIKLTDFNFSIFFFHINKP